MRRKAKHVWKPGDLTIESLPNPGGRDLPRVGIVVAVTERWFETEPKRGPGGALRYNKHSGMQHPRGSSYYFRHARLATAEEAAVAEAAIRRAGYIRTVQAFCASEIEETSDEQLQSLLGIVREVRAIAGRSTETTE